MNKKSKNILLFIFLAVFLIPELLWFPISDVFFSFSDIYHISRNNFLDSISLNSISFIISLQTIGIIGFSILIIKRIRQSFGAKKAGLLLLSILSVVLSVISLFVFLISVSLRNIGF